MRWSEMAGGVSGAARRVLVEAGPGAGPFDAMRLVYSIGDGPERVTRGWPLGPDPETGLFRYAADLPDAATDQPVAWRPILTACGREIDPGRVLPPMNTPTNAQMSADKTPARPPAAGGGLEFIAAFTVLFSDQFHPLGETPDGVRLHFAIRDGGRVEGPRLRGKLLAVGGDWMRVRPDGVGLVDAKALIEPDGGGGLIMLEETGTCDFGPDGYQRVAKGQLPATAPVRLTPRYLTSNPKFLWLNRLQGFAVGHADLATVSLHYNVFTSKGPAHG